MADNVGKGRDCRDDIGDCAVVMTIIMVQCGLGFHAYAENLNFISQYDIKYNVAQLEVIFLSSFPTSPLITKYQIAAMLSSGALNI